MYKWVLLTQIILRGSAWWMRTWLELGIDRSWKSGLKTWSGWLWLRSDPYICKALWVTQFAWKAPQIWIDLLTLIELKIFRFYSLIRSGGPHEINHRETIQLEPDDLKYQLSKKYCVPFCLGQKRRCFYHQSYISLQCCSLVFLKRLFQVYNYYKTQQLVSWLRPEGGSILHRF